MTIQERVTLLNAGYTKETIDAWEAASAAPVQQPAPAPAPQVVQQVTPAPVQVQQVTPAPVQQVTAPQPVTLSPEQLTQLIQGVAVQTSSGTIETPPSAEESLRKLFESVAGTVNKKED